MAEIKDTFVDFLNDHVLSGPALVSCMIVMRADGTIATYTDEGHANGQGWAQIAAQMDEARRSMAGVILITTKPHDPFGAMPETIEVTQADFKVPDVEDLSWLKTYSKEDKDAGDKS